LAVRSYLQPAIVHRRVNIRHGELKKMRERMFLEADAGWKVHTWVADALRVALNGPSTRKSSR
jgi:hypothetical protein